MEQSFKILNKMFTTENSMSHLDPDIVDVVVGSRSVKNSYVVVV